MDVTTMPSTPSLIDRLSERYPAFRFTAGDRFEWQPETSAILFDIDDPLFEARLLHELGHATLGHKTYDRDIDLIAMERDAWQVARMELGPEFSVVIDGDTIHHDMDTYRDWLHARSTCPHCESTGIQIRKAEYQCVTCRKHWRVNEAKHCQLRRYKLT